MPGGLMRRPFPRDTRIIDGRGRTKVKIYGQNIDHPLGPVSEPSRTLKIDEIPMGMVRIYGRLPHYYHLGRQ